jgi:signal-transduction protein with cAMP-binding, CBS, and nucleotidyltransferase domain
MMTPIVHSVSERASVEAVASMMARKHIHRVIVRRGQKIVGVISAIDVLSALSTSLRRRTAKKK